MDKYYEQMAAGYKSALHTFFTVLMYVSLIICAATIFLFYPAAIFCGALSVLLYFLKQREHMEYEYIFTNGDVDIDRIVEARRRKKVTHFDVKEVYILAPEGSCSLSGIPQGKKIKAYSKKDDSQKYIAVIKKDNAVVWVYFAPDEEFLSLCFKSNPRNVKKV